MKYEQRIKNLRKDKDYSQAKAAEAMGISQQQYSLYESGKRMLPIDMLIRLCYFYNISADYILGFTNDPKPLPKK